MILVVVGVTVVVNVASEPRHLSVVCPENDTEESSPRKIVPTPITLVPEAPLFRVTLSLYARAPRSDKSS